MLSDDPVLNDWIESKPAGTVLMTKAMASRVLAVVVKGDVDDWAAYIAAVPGKDHEQEKTYVAGSGDKLDKRIAADLFPALDIAKYRS